MKVLLSWLREFAPALADHDPAWLADELSALGLAVEDVVHLGGGLDGIIVAKVLALRPHPNADKVQLVDVDTGDGEALQICCGAFNMAVGDLVPLATLGTTMPDGRLIERRKLRGEWSNGMLCSAAEMGFGSDGGGIYILGAGLPLGEDLKTALGIEVDVLYDLDVTGNRPDAMSVAGVARDLAAWLKLPFHLPEPAVAEAGTPTAELAEVTIESPDLCGRFVARVLSGIAVGPSPQWLANRVTALGMRPINIVVDVSNYVMLELGQPSHTFDLHLIEGRRLAVRWARDGEQLVTLDGQTRTLTSRDGVIADGTGTPVAVAGVMGGASTEIHVATTDVLVEMAWWDPLSIARTARRLGLRSEASTRFERGADPGVVPLAMRRFAELLQPAQLHPGSIEANGTLPARTPIRVRTDRVNLVLGTALDPGTIRSVIEPIGFDCTPTSDGFEVTVPTWRMVDSSTEIDVIEEVGRLYGLRNIAPTVPHPPNQSGALSEHQQDRRRLRRALVGFGLTEVMPLPFLAPGDLDRAGLGAEAITVTNPLDARESVMRTSLRPGLLKTVAHNARHRTFGVEVFEIGHIYLPTDRSAELPDEREHVAIALAGREAPAAVEAWQVIADALQLGDGEVRLQAAAPAGMHPTRSAQIEVGGQVVGTVGELDPAVCEAYEVGERVAFVEVDLTALLALPHGLRPYRRVSTQPSADIDLAFATPDHVPAAAVEASLRAAAGDLLVGLELFDVYRAGALGEGRRSLAFRLRLQAPDRTLTDVEIGAVRQRCITTVEDAHGAMLRA
jgi:phenylalanyl-tRNA synthetase beta chain